MFIWVIVSIFTLRETEIQRKAEPESQRNTEEEETEREKERKEGGQEKEVVR